jgi:hypothetical protein
MTIKIPDKNGQDMGNAEKSILQYIFLFFVWTLLWAGCAMVPLPTRSVHIGQSGEVGSCADFFASLDKQTEDAEVLDPGVFRVKDYPYLRVNRFIASFRETVDEKAAFNEWVKRMQALDQDARKFEIANLPDSAVVSLDSLNHRAGLYRKVDTCGDILKAADFQNVENQKKLRKSVSVPDDYIPLRRVLGLYPLTRWFVSHGVSKWHAEVHKTFSVDPPVGWQSIRYFPAKSFNLSRPRPIIKSTKRDALGIPIYSPKERETLFQKWAPVWEIQFKGEYDRIGIPIWTGNGVLKVDTGQPLTYTLLSFTRFGKEILTQLNYIIWFPSRPKRGALDIYGGLLDGLNYRVTLDNNGEAILYETIHNCGCYYKAYPSSRLQALEKIDYAEPPLILKAPDINPSKNVMTVAVETRTHFVQHLYPSTRESQPAMTVYSLADYNRLRSLPYSSDRRKSMFDQSSIVPESDRLERFILWITGVYSPGAMRQWGRHAVAFVGRRDFDDPFYMDKMFKETDGK